VKLVKNKHRKKERKKVLGDREESKEKVMNWSTEAAAAAVKNKKGVS
jgi:hypothetical protein